MKAQELRIGNLIKYADEDVIIEVNAISEYTGEVIPIKDINGMEGEEWSIESFEPIPLTEEWLLKFGFERCSSVYSDVKSYSINEDYKQLIWCESDLYKRLPDGFIRISNGDACQYVHQLQNLYYALTGEELTIKAHAV